VEQEITLYSALLLCFFMESVRMTEAAVFLQLQFFWCSTFILGRRIISSLTLTAFKRNNLSHILSLMYHRVLFIEWITPLLQRSPLPLPSYLPLVSQTSTPSPTQSALSTPPSSLHYPQASPSLPPPVTSHFPSHPSS